MVTLETSRPFHCLGPADADALRQIAREHRFAAGSEIFKEGDSGDGIYVVKDGLVEISAEIARDARRVFAQLGPGEMFGEMAVLELKPRSATVTTVEDTVVYFIPRDELLAMLECSPKLSLEMLREISQRLREFNRRYIEEILQTERLAIVGRFARSIIHDLKNPLNIIGLTAEMAGMEKASPEMRQRSAVTIRKQVERINDMVGDILDFTQGARTGTILGSTDYAAFVNHLAEELRPEVEVRGAELELVAPLASARLPIEPKRLRRVFQNLIHNASDAMPDGGTILIRTQNDGANLVTEIQDSGPGIAPEIADRLFEMFTTFGKEHGTGLGLSICKRIIEDHHGRIWARNGSSRGAVFCFSLPLTANA